MTDTTSSKPKVSISAMRTILHMGNVRQLLSLAHARAREAGSLVRLATQGCFVASIASWCGHSNFMTFADRERGRGDGGLKRSFLCFV